MSDLNFLAVLVASVAAFVLSGVWYAGLGGQLASLHPAYAAPAGSRAATVAVELVRNVVVALVTAGLAALVGVAGLAGGFLLGLALWVVPRRPAGRVGLPREGPAEARRHPRRGLAAETRRHRRHRRNVALSPRKAPVGKGMPVTPGIRLPISSTGRPMAE